jgi:hypothetical protein
MRKKIFSSAALASLALFLVVPMHAQSSAPLTVTALVENQVCLSKDFVQVNLSASATSDSQPVGFRWDFTNNGSFDTRRNTDPSETHIYPDESPVTVRVGAINKAGERAQDTITFSTLRCR